MTEGRLTPALIFSMTTTRDGTTSSTSKVANPRPKQIVIAIGTIYMASADDSNINGVKPATVVSDVRMTALNRDKDASLIDSKVFMPASRFLLKKLISTIESLTTMPVSEKNANKDIAPISTPIIQ